MSEPANNDNAALQRTPLHALHVKLGAKMVPFAGYDMPVNYPSGVIAEHRHCRSAAALFDVSHMGQLRLAGADAAAALETLAPVDVVDLAPGKQRYAFFTNASGGLLDDFMITRPLPADAEQGFGDLFLVVNAACKAADTRHLVTHIGHRCQVVPLPDRALLALQGPKARAVMKRLAPEAAALSFMNLCRAAIEGERCFVACCGYTGEDGFEILAPMSAAPTIIEWLLAQPEVKPIGLGARDTLRLEAGLCLYGHELDQTTSPIEAGLAWTVQKRRRKAKDFPGATRILRELKDGPARTRVGIAIKEKAPARDGVEIHKDGRKIGIVTSGGFSPTLNVPISMGYVETQFAAPDTPIDLIVRGQARAAEIAPLPFVPHRYSKD